MAVKPFDLALLFTGHMIDLPGRPEPRFPQYAEPLAWAAIRDKLEEARQRTKGRMVGIASGARGGDLMFHEACRLFGIERRMVLPFPVDAFIEASVAGVPNAGWEAKFKDNWGSLQESEREIVLPQKDSKGFALCNKRMIELAQTLAKSYEVVALWDGKAGDGPGGTQAHVEAVRALGGRVEIIDANALRNAAG